MIRQILLAAALLGLSSVGSAQDPVDDGVVQLETVHVQGRRFRPISIILPRQHDLVDARPERRPDMVRRVVSTVRRAPF